MVALFSRALPMSSGLALLLLAVLLPAVTTVVGKSVPAPQPCYKRFDGVGNNAQHPLWGSVGQPLRRLAAPQYADGVSAMRTDLPNPRALSNAVGAQGALDMFSHRNLTDMVTWWGQFLDHDTSLTGDSSGENAPIPVPACDPVFDPSCSGSATIPFHRSAFVESSNSPRQQLVSITAFLDGDTIYGETAERAAALRGQHGLLDSQFIDGEEFPPWNADHHDMANPTHRPLEQLLFMGDRRGNEQPALLALHVLWVREHNRLARQMNKQHPSWSDDEVFDAARRQVLALFQSITFYEYLPTLLGAPFPIPPYAGYDDTVDPTVATEFSTAFFRMGHTQIAADLPRVDDHGHTVPDGDLLFQHTFFRPESVIGGDSMDSVLRGAATQAQQEFDTRVTDAVRNMLFGMPIDLFALNVQRGRDHGLPDLNSARIALGLPPYSSFDDFPVNEPQVRDALRHLYNDKIGDLDLWVGVLAEARVPGSSLSQTAAHGILDQLQRMRVGDSCWFEAPGVLTEQELQVVRNTRLSDVIRRNTDIRCIPDNVFQLSSDWDWCASSHHDEHNEHDEHTDPAEHNAATFLLDAGLRMLREESATGPSEPCVLNGDGPGIFTPLGSARFIRYVTTAMFDASSVYNQHSVPVAAPNVPDTTSMELERFKQRVTLEEAVLHAGYLAMQALLPEGVQRFGMAALLQDHFPHVLGTKLTDGDDTPLVLARLHDALRSLMRNDNSNQEGCYADTGDFVPPNDPTRLDTLADVQAAAAANRRLSGWSQIIKSGQIEAPRNYLTPHASSFRAFAMTGSNCFRPPPLPRADELERQFLEVADYSTRLDQDHGRLKLIAEFWADGPRSTLPPGHWQEIAIEAARDADLSLERTVHLLFMTGSAVWDAGIAAWDAKRYYASVRPATYIPVRFLERVLPGSYRGPYCPPGDIQAWQWQPYQAAKFVTPPFPEYVSGHSTFSAASAEVLSLFFGSDQIPGGAKTYTVPRGKSLFEAYCSRDGIDLDGNPCVFQECQADSSYNSENRFTPDQDVTLGPWSTFRELADESGVSRLYGGIHITVGDLEGRKMGRSVGRVVFRKAMAHIDRRLRPGCPAN